jgi:hypothetical protein
MEFTARTVVGPDEPFGGHTYRSMAAGHWVTLAATLVQQEHPSPRARTGGGSPSWSS